MKKLLPVLLVVCLFSCRKKEIEKEKETLSGLNGTWIGIGSSSSSSTMSSLDAFYPISVQVIDENNVSVFGRTLLLKTGKSNEDSAVFEYVPDYNPRSESATLIYYRRNRVVSYGRWGGSSSGYGTFHLSSEDYHTNPFVKDIVKKLSGTRTFSGTIHDMSYSPPSDTTYNASIQVTFTIVNDSTLAFDRSVLMPGGDTMHYKATDNSANTVTFETFHLYDDDVITVMYNVTADAVTLKEWRGNYPDRVDVDLK